LKKAIIIPFNPHLDFHGGSAIGSLLAHKMFADKKGAVFWDLARAREYEDVKVAYFYDTDEKTVTFKAKIEYVKTKKKIALEEERFIPNWRKVNWEGKQEPGQVWLKLTDIFPLKRKHLLSDFRKVSDGERLRRVQNFAIVMDPDYKEERTVFSMERFVDDYIYRLVSHEEEKLKEKDIEEMLWFLMQEKNLESIRRQEGKDNRIDVVFKGPKNQYVIVEIKRGTASIAPLEQIKRYINAVQTENETEKVFGIILCKKADVRLKQAVEKEERIYIDEYRFSIDFPKINKILETF